ncbi:MAG: GIY-YIG nuclease family protein [Candidatus Margulisiibacteriota bacterium]
MPYHLYILQCTNGSLYTGITNNLERRFNEHFSGKGCKYTIANPAKKMRYTEKFETRSEAAKREAQIKGWTRTKKLALIKGHKGILKTSARCKNRQK